MPPISDRAYLKQEMAKRELARKSYRWYLYYVHGQQWRRTKMSDFLADTVQKFVEEDTGNAYARRRGRRTVSHLFPQSRGRSRSFGTIGGRGRQQPYYL